MVEGCHKGEEMDLNAVKENACMQYGLYRAPKLVKMIVALLENNKEMVLPKLRVKPMHTTFGIVIVIVMLKPHRCPHISTT
ncbi:hypothetical protein SUGI_0840420 [Cryptomeria japonica]|nr:hypothetical protein SUGI_0840420 [Cryptomeria japonica]